MDRETDLKKTSGDKLSITMSNLKKRLFSENKLSSHKAGEKGVELILENDFKGALQYFKQALCIDPTDDRHYLNRSYCHLKMRNYALTLADLSYILKKSDVPAYLFIANLRSGQAAVGLMEYKEAESFFKAAISIDHESPYPKRELMRLKITCLVNEGYSERDALSLLEISPQVDIPYSTENVQVQSYLQILDDLNDDLVYSSDDEESSNFQILNRILNYEPSKIKLDQIANNELSTVSKMNVLETLNNNSKIEHKDPSETTKQNSSILGSPLPHAKSFSDDISLEMRSPENKKLFIDKYSIWVGNLWNGITELMLRGLFSQYGCIINVHRPHNTNYAFITFYDDKSVLSILQFTFYQIHGWPIIVRPAKMKLT